jgi:transposase
MVRGIAITTEKFEQVIQMYKDGRSYREIFRITKIPLSTVRNCVIRFLKKKKSPKTGAPRKLSTRDERKIKRSLKKAPSTSLR